MRQFGKYEILRQLGQGGMGTVYEAELVGPGGFRKAVALKVLSGQAATVDGLAREAALGGLLRHPNLVDTYEFGEVEDVAYIAMEFVDGPTLAQLMRGRPLPPDAVVQIGQQIATGLSHAHAARHADGTPMGLVHRDLKPANVIVSRFGVVKIADLGIATTHRDDERHAIGTPGYMSPEQWLNGAVDARSDLWSLGSILFRAATGISLTRPRTSPLSIQNRLLSGEIAGQVDEVAPGLGPIIQDCLQLDPNDRPERAGIVRRALAQVAPIGSGSLTSVLGQALQDIAMSQIVGAPTNSIDTESREPPKPETAILPTHVSDATTVVVAFDNIGREPDGFHGREAEIKLGRQRLAAGVRCLAFVGAAGIGKSRLARHLARQLPGAFPGGRLWVDAGSCRNLGDLMRALASPLKLDPTSGIDDIERELGNAGEIILILDGCDKLRARVAGQIAQLQVRLPRLRLATTGRASLGLPGEDVIHVERLDGPAAAALFCDRAKIEHTPAIDALCEALDGHPLAIELATERARLMPVARLLSMVEKDPFRLLKTTRRGVADRHRSMEACVRFGWMALSEDARRAAVQLAASDAPVDWELLGTLVQSSEGEDEAWALDAIEALRSESFVRLQGQRSFELPTMHRKFVARVAEDAFPGLLAEARARIPATSQGRD